VVTFGPTFPSTSHPLFPLSSTSLPITPNLSPLYPSFLHTCHLLTSLLYQLHTTPIPCNPWCKHLPLQQQKYTQTHMRTTKSSNPHNSQPTLSLLFPPPFCFIMLPLPIPHNLYLA
jgi:hypothetical protein